MPFADIVRNRPQHRVRAEPLDKIYFKPYTLRYHRPCSLPPFKKHNKMKLIHNTGTDRVIDLFRTHLTGGSEFACITPDFSLFAFAELLQALQGVSRAQLILPPEDALLQFLGGDGDRAARNRLQARYLAHQCAQWVARKVALRRAHGTVPQTMAVLRDSAAQPLQVVQGAFSFCTAGLGLTPGNPLSLIQASETPQEAASLHAQAAKATQLAHQVALNLALARVKAQLRIEKAKL
jgi:hypothetical protein